jgi:riboflavin synthase
MFTGIIQEVGKLKSKASRGPNALFTFKTSKKFMKGVKIGESIAVEGVCLTVMKRGEDAFSAELIPETLENTTLGLLQPGKSLVNLEKALHMGDSLGGHLVSGHVDEKGQIEAFERRGENGLLRICPSATFLKQLVPKGSVAVDGISLTVQKITEKAFEAGIIPHTWAVTSLNPKKKGDWVNLEADLFYKYVKQALELR